MIFSYLTEDNLFDRYVESKQFTYLLTKPFIEFERIARNRPAGNIPKELPKTTDGTTASIIRKTPRRIIQQLPTGSVIADDGGWHGIVGTFIFTEKIIRKANEDYSLIQKGWTVIEKALTFGAAATYTPFIDHDGEFSPDLSVPYWGDVFIQPGKKSGYSCKYVFMRSWWQKEDIKALIDREKKLASKAKGRKEQYDGTWDLDALNDALTSMKGKDEVGRTPQEKERSMDTQAIEMVTAFQVGVKSTFYTFVPDLKLITRRKQNQDPRGKIPIDWMYGDIDGSNPLGRGLIELIGGLQNLIDNDMQMYQYNRALMLNPPIIKKGNYSKKSLVYQPNQIIDLGTDPGNSATPLTIDTSAIANYPALYGLQKSQLLNLVNSPDTSIAADVGNPGFSKTPAGINQQQATISVDDNYIGKMFETWFENWAETAINIYFAERHGIEELQLDKETAMKLREMPVTKDFDPATFVSPDNKIRIDYDQETPKLKFHVDPSTTKKKDEAAQVASASNLLDLVMKYPMLNSSYGGPIDIDVLSRRIVVNSGIDDPEQVAPEPTEEQKQAKEQAKHSTSPFSPMFDKPSIRMNFPDLPMAAQIQVLANAGVNVTPQDMMQGPVVDPNIRGVMNPVSDPNALMPGGQVDQNGQPVPSQQTQGAGAAPIDLGDIYKQTTDPQVKAEIEAMAGLHPSVEHVQNAVTTNITQHLADQTGHINAAAQAVAPSVPEAPAQSAQAPQQQPQQPTDQQPEQESPQEDAQELQQMSDVDRQLIMHLRALGLPEQIIQEAVEMAESGYTADQIMQAIGAARSAQ